METVETLEIMPSIYEPPEEKEIGNFLNAVDEHVESIYLQTPFTGYYSFLRGQLAIELCDHEPNLDISILYPSVRMYALGKATIKDRARWEMPLFPTKARAEEYQKECCYKYVKEIFNKPISTTYLNKYQKERIIELTLFGKDYEKDVKNGLIKIDDHGKALLECKTLATLVALKESGKEYQLRKELFKFYKGTFRLFFVHKWSKDKFEAMFNEMLMKKYEANQKLIER